MSKILQTSNGYKVMYHDKAFQGSFMNSIKWAWKCMYSEFFNLQRRGVDYIPSSCLPCLCPKDGHSTRFYKVLGCYNDR